MPVAGPVRVVSCSRWRWGASVLASICMLAGSVPAPAHAWLQDVGSFGFAYGLTDVPVSSVDPSGDVVSVGRLDVPQGTGFPRTAFAVVKHAGATGEELWRHTVLGIPGSNGQGEAVAVDASGDVVAEGTLGDQTASAVVVMKLSGTTGVELWRAEIARLSYPYLTSDVAVAIDAAGDVLATGGAQATFFGVVKLSGQSGAELWRSRNPGGAIAVKVDAARDVFAAALGFGVVKLAGADGTELWRTMIDRGEATALALDAAGDAILAGALAPPYPAPRSMATIKLSGTSGAELWRNEINGATPYDDRATAVTVDAAGDVVTAGFVGNPPPSPNAGTWHDLVVAKLAGASGSELWRSVIDGPAAQNDPDEAWAVALDMAEDVIVAGQYADVGTEGLGSAIGPAVLKLAGATGAQVWRQNLGRAGTVGRAGAVGVDAAGGVFASAFLVPNVHVAIPAKYLVMRLSDMDGTLGPVAGTSLLVRDRAGNAAVRRLAAELQDPSIETPPPGSAGDPTLNGAEVRLLNPTTAESGVVVLPAGRSWTRLGTPPGAGGYSYVDPSGTNGPCTQLLARSHKKIKLRCSGSRGPIPFSLDEPSQGALTVSVRLGSGDPQCATFGGRVLSDAGTSSPGPNGYFNAQRASAVPGACP